MTPADFIASIAPAAKASMALTKIPASFVIAEGALESAWGDSELCRNARNIFGVKADAAWRGATVSMPTHEVIRGKTVQVQALWRAYPDYLSCIRDHALFLLDNPRYAPALQHADNAEIFAQGVAAAGYATDPDYAAKIIAIIRAHGLTEYDA
jgi:flagellum-specific peptidoglycan hydrolase FlgJ